MKIFQLVAAFAVTTLAAATRLGSENKGPARRASLSHPAVNNLAGRNLEYVTGDVPPYSRVLAYYEEALASHNEKHEDDSTQGKTAGKRSSSGFSAALLRREEDRANELTTTETSKECPQCSDYMRDCKSKCAHPKRPECTWRCLAFLCAGRGPPECTVGTACGTASNCIGESWRSVAVPQARDNGDGWDQGECNDYISGCLGAFCRDSFNAPKNGPTCPQACHDVLCDTQPKCCKP